jgi:hypothetical protein
MLLVVDIFDRLQIPYLVGGSMASALYGVARSTLDADIVAELRYEQAHDLVAALGEDFYADDEMIGGAIQQRNIQCRKSPLEGSLIIIPVSVINLAGGEQS